MVMQTQELIIVPIPMSYRDIANDLAARIANGEYQPGQQLPSHQELADLYSVSPSTATRAYGLLVDRGIVTGRQGRGVFVPEDPTPNE
jgi:DNA-binding GntR family transcriptional regulator